MQHALVFASVGPIIDIRLVSSINWLSSQVRRLTLPAGSAGQFCALGTACLLGSPCILKPCCISRKALGMASVLNSPCQEHLVFIAHFSLGIVQSFCGRQGTAHFSAAGSSCPGCQTMTSSRYARLWILWVTRSPMPALGWLALQP